MSTSNHGLPPCPVQAFFPWLLAAGMVLLSGCMPSLDSTHPPARIYWLDAVPVIDPPPIRPVVALAPGLDSDRIRVLEADRRLNHYAGAFWPAGLDRLLQDLLERSLAARDDGQRVRVEIERFFAIAGEAGGAPDVELAAIIDTGTLRCRYRKVSTAESERLAHVVAAHQALVAALADAVSETVRGERCL